jgi:hypothetical protein
MDAAITGESTMTRVIFPDEAWLDTGGWNGDGYSVCLYLVPAAESDSGKPEVVAHCGIGNTGTPEPAWHRRWSCIGGYGEGYVGSSVLRALESLEEWFLETSESYLGSVWNGNNYVGKWDGDDSDDSDWDEGPWESAICDLQTYWTADDWFGPANIGWIELCALVKVDPERALGDDWESVARAVGDDAAEGEDEHISGADDYAVEMAEEWRREQCDDDA